MKQLFIILILMIGLACNQEQQRADNKTEEATINHSDTLLGTWVIGSFLTNRGTLIPHVSSKIEFRKNGFALHTLPGNVSDSLNWFITKDTMHLKYIHPKTKMPFFLGQKFKITFIDSLKIPELRLARDSAFIYILTRPK